MGNMMVVIKRNLAGQKFNELTAIEPISKNRSGHTVWKFKCSCGADYTCSMDWVTRKKTPVKSCGCLKKGIKGPNHPQWNGYADISGNWWYNHVLRERKQTARIKVAVTITIEEAWNIFIKQNKKCALSGIILRIDSTNKYNTASIDRIDSSKGYEIDNVQWVHKHVNFMKRIYSQQYFIEICKKIASTHQN